MKFLQFILKLVLNVISSFLIVIGMYLTIAGAISGLGHDSLLTKIEISAGGVGLVCIGFYLLYLANDRSFSKMINTILNAVLRPF